ncbi:MAG: polysaccharide deacetylase family protein [bacterium]
MKKIFSFFNAFSNNVKDGIKNLTGTQKTHIKYFVLLSFMCVALVGVTRPIIQNALNTQAVSSQAEKSSKNLPIYCVNTDENKVGISFDAAWGADDTEELLTILANNDVKATFFLCGYWVDDYPDEVKRIFEEGHEIGNHSDTHPHGSQISLEQNKQEISAVHEKVKELLDYEMSLYRPPFGEYNDTVLQAASELNYHTIQWDIDSLDWKEYGVEHEVNQVLNHSHLGNGSIMLFHNDAEYTPDSLDTILKGLKEKGFEVVPIGELIHTENYYMDHEGRQHKEQAN